MSKISEVIRKIEEITPAKYQENYDNSGLLVGDPDTEVKQILITLDVIPEIVEEAINKGCNLIIAHHPIIFKGIKRLTGKNYVEKTIILAIENKIAIYCAHTNLDNMVKNGVNGFISNKLNLKSVSSLLPKPDTLLKLVTFIPSEKTNEVMSKVHEAGAGQIGEYSNCSFRITGRGYFTPSDYANPAIGESNKPETVEEDRIEVILPIHKKTQILNALKKHHPYEEVAYYISEVINENQEIGSGIVGELSEPMDVQKFIEFIRTEFDLKVIKHTRLCKSPICKVAYCGGSGSFLLHNAKAKKADVFITSDFKYHDYFDAEGDIIILDIGHYESEIHTKEIFFEILSKKFSSIALYLSEVITNPIQYYY